jgi:hypothetical protein
MGQPSTGAALARGGSVLAASLLFLLGVFHIISGIAAFARDNFYNVGANYPYQTSNTTWGWLHLIGGVLLAITGLALFGQSAWARWVAIALAGVSVILNFFFLPYFPLWALVMIPLAIFCIWALVRDGSEQRQREMMMAQRSTAGAFGTPSGTQQQMGAGTYSSGQTGQRWPENVGGREQPSDVKETAGRMGEQAQERAQSGARGSGQQQGRSAAEEAAERAQQSGNRDYRSGR